MLFEVVLCFRERQRQRETETGRQIDRETEGERQGDRAINSPSSSWETETENERTEKRNVIFSQVIAPTEGGISQLIVKFAHHFSNIVLYKHTGSQISSTKYQQNTKY